MALLTRLSVKRIMDQLDESCFTNAAFEVETPNSGDNLAHIRFCDRPEYQFSIHTGYEGFNVIYIPGNVYSTVNQSQKTFDDCLKSLKNWTNNIRSELLTVNPLYNEFEEFKKLLNDTIEEKYKTSYEAFSPEEFNNLKTSFDDLNRKLEDLHFKATLTEKELEEIKKTMGELLNDAEKFPKKVWYRAFGNNMVKLITKTLGTSAGQKLLEDGARRLLDLPPQN